MMFFDKTNSVCLRHLKNGVLQRQLLGKKHHKSDPKGAKYEWCMLVIIFDRGTHGWLQSKTENNVRLESKLTWHEHLPVYN